MQLMPLRPNVQSREGSKAIWGPCRILKVPPPKRDPQWGLKGEPPGPPPLFFVTVPVESTQFAEYKRLLYDQGVVDCNGNLLLSSMSARSLHADAAQYRFDIGCTLSALACVKGYPHFNYMGADGGEEFQLLHMGEKPEDRDWLWVSNKSNQAGWISRAVVGKRGLAYYPWHAGATRLLGQSR